MVPLDVRRASDFPRGTTTRQSVPTGETWGMVDSRAVVAAILGAVLAACGTGAASSPPPVQPRTDAPDVAVTPSAASVTAAPTPVSQRPSPTPRPTPTPTPVPEPPMPTGVTFHVQQVNVGDDAAEAEITQRVTWRAPRTEGVEIRVFGVTECLARPMDPEAGGSGQCLVEHTALPASVRTLLGTAPASAGIVSWSWTGGFECVIGLQHDPDGPAYSAVVLAAYSASGHSIFAIAEPGLWLRPGPNEVIC